MKTCKGCKHYKKYEKTNIITCEFLGETNYCEKDKEEFAITELEKIKADIEEHNRKYLSDDNAGLERAIWDFIDPRIAELKGETE